MSDASQALEIEGLAAQLYVASKGLGSYIWWHLLRDEVKADFREQAKHKIEAYAAHRFL